MLVVVRHGVVRADSALLLIKVDVRRSVGEGARPSVVGSGGG